MSIRSVIRTLRCTYEAPAQAVPVGEPLITSQYVPSGSEVENVAVHAESALLIATNPRAPKTRARRSVTIDVQAENECAYRGQTRSAATAGRPSW